MKTDNLETIDTTSLSAASGGLFGPFDAILGPLQAQSEHERACAQAKHWEQNGKQPGATDGEKNYATYLRQFCPRRVLDPKSW